MLTKEKMIEFIRKQKVAFVASVDEEGFPNMKAMYTPRKIEGNEFYFTTNTSSVRVQQFMRNPKASIYFYNKGRFRYEGIMLAGTMEILTDEKIKEEIWEPGDTMYYKQGVADRDYCVLKFTAVRGRHYCALKSESFEVGTDELKRAVTGMEELRSIMEKFAASGWDLIDGPAKEWLEGRADKDKLIAAIRQADRDCGSCGCDMDPLYKRALELLA